MNVKGFTKNYRQWLLAIGLAIFFTSIPLHAHTETQPKFSIIPLTTTTFSLPFNQTAIVEYRVINNTKITRQLTMGPLESVTQITSDTDLCANPFTLAHGQSCLLRLFIDGSQLQKSINSPITICKTNGPTDNKPDPFLCSQTTETNGLHITPAPAIYDVGGSITGLNINGLILENGGVIQSIRSGASSYHFTVQVNSFYDINIVQQPTGLTCAVENSSGGPVTGAITNANVICSTVTFSVGGSITGLANSGLTLKNGGITQIISSGALSYHFTVPYGHIYDITITQQPTGLTCSIANPQGGPVTANVTNAKITCSPITFTVGGNITGLTSSGLELKNAGVKQTIAVNAKSYQFTVAYGSFYDITITHQPSDLTCSIAHPSGGPVTTNIYNANVTCNPTNLSVGGSISALTTTGLRLKNGGSTQTIPANTSSYEFTIPYDTAYDITIQTQPQGLTCTIANASSNNVPITTNITNANVTCSTQTFTVGGNITGLTSSGLILKNAAVALPVSSGSSSYAFTVDENSSYNVTIQQNPTGLQCSVQNPSGGPVVADVTNVNVTCIAVYAFILNSGEGPSSTSCNVSGTSLTNCIYSGAGTYNSGGFVLNQAGTIAYFTNLDTSAYNVEACTISGNTMSGCIPSTISNSTPLPLVGSWIALDPSGTPAYVGDGEPYTTEQPWQCSVSSTSLTGCSRSGPIGLEDGTLNIVIDSTGTCAYITGGVEKNEVYVCAILSNLTNCGDSGATLLDQPSGIALSPDGTVAFITNLRDSSVTECVVNSQDTCSAIVPNPSRLSNCTKQSSLPTVTDPTGITLNATGTLAFIVNGTYLEGGGTVTACAVNAGSLSDCSNTGAININNPLSIIGLF